MTRAERVRRSGFSLRLEQGQGRLVLTDRRLGALLFVEQLHLGLHHLPARLDMTDGVERFRHARTRLDLLTVVLEEQELAAAIRDRTVGTSLRELDLRVVDGDIVIAGEVHEGVPFVCRARLEPASMAGERALLISVYEVRVFGPCRSSPPEVALLALQAADLGRSLAGPTCAVLDPIDRLAAEVFADLGWKLPDRTGTRLTEVRADAGRVRLVASRVEGPRSGLRGVEAVDSPAGAMRYRRFLADYEAKTLYAALEAEITAGRIERAASSYERQLELHPDHPFLVARLLQLWQSRPESHPDATALARAHLDRYPDDLNALVALAVVQQAEGDVSGAAELYRRVARIAERQGDPIEAAQALCAVARTIGARDPVLAIEALERALALRRRLPGALRALATLHERAGNIAGAIQARERVLANEPPGRARAELLLELGRLTLERAADPEAACAWYERLIEEWPEEVEAWLGQAAAHERAGRLLPAVRALDRAVVLLQQRGESRRAARVLVRLADLWASLPEGGWATASLRYRQALLLEPGLPEALLGLAESAAADGDARRARTHLEELIRQGPMTPAGDPIAASTRSDAHLRLGRLFSQTLGDPLQAIGHYQKALEGDDELAEEALTALEGLFTATDRPDDLARVLELAAARTEDVELRAARLFRLGAVLRDGLGDPGRAALILTEAARLQPTRPDYLRALIDLQKDRNESAAAAEALSILIASREEPVELAALYCERALLLKANLNRASEAGDAWALALGCDPTCLAAMEGLCDLYRERERTPELVAVLWRWAALEPDGAVAARLYLELGRLARSTLSRPEDARLAYEQVLKREPDDTEALRGLGDLALEQGQPAVALAQYERLLALYDKEGFDEPAGPFLLCLALVFEQLNREREAVAQLQRARDLDPEALDVYEAAQDLLLRAGDLEAIVEFFAGGLKRARRAETRYFLARRAGRLVWRELRRPADAAVLLDAALAAAPPPPQDADVLGLRLEVATALADWPSVASLLRTQLDRATPRERPALLSRLAELAFGALSRPDEGIELARAALLEDPAYIPALTLLADQTFAAADWETAGDAYESLVSLDAERARPEDRLRLAVARLHAGQTGAALAVLQALSAEGVVLPDLAETLAEASLRAGDTSALAPAIPLGLAERGDSGGAPTLEILSPFRTVGFGTADDAVAGAEGTAEARRSRFLAQAEQLEAAALAAVDPGEAATQWLAAGEVHRDDLHAPERAEHAFSQAMASSPPGGAVWRAAEEALEEFCSARNDWRALSVLYQARLDHGVGDRVELLILMASVLRLAGDPERAIAAAIRALPDDRARLLLVALHEAAGQPQLAADRLAEGLESLDPQEAVERCVRAATLVRDLDPERACAFYGQVAVQIDDPTIAEAFLACARNLGQPGPLVLALEANARLTVAAGAGAIRRSRLLHEAAGAALGGLKDAARARALVDAAVDAWPDNVEALERQAEILELLGDGDALVVSLERQRAAAMPGPWRGRLGLRLARAHRELRGDAAAADRAARAAATDLNGPLDADDTGLEATPVPESPSGVTRGPAPSLESRAGLQVTVLKQAFAAGDLAAVLSGGAALREMPEALWRSELDGEPAWRRGVVALDEALDAARRAR